MKKIYFNDDNWDYPIILNEYGDEIDNLSVGDKDMQSFVSINGSIYCSNYGESHYGAILNALFKLFNVNSVDKIEKRFSQQIDDVLSDIRDEEVEYEGRIWYRYNLIQITNKNNFQVNELDVAKKIGMSIDKLNIIGKYNEDVNGYLITPIKIYEQTIKHMIKESIIKKLKH